MPLLYHSVPHIPGFLCLFDENEILFERWWKIVESVKMLGMEHSFSHLAAISECKNSLHPSCNILKLIGISNTAWQSLNMRQVARPKECVCSRVGAKRGSWGTAGELLGGGEDGYTGRHGYMGRHGWPGYPGSWIICWETRQIKWDAEHMWNSRSKTIKTRSEVKAPESVLWSFSLV